MKRGGEGSSQIDSPQKKILSKSWALLRLTVRQPKYQHLTRGGILPSKGKAKFTYSRLGKALKKQTKTIENQGGKKMKALEEHEKQLV